MIVSAGTSRKGFCNVATKKVSFDGTTKANFALSCYDLFLAFPFTADGSYFIGANAKVAKEAKCVKIKVKKSRDPRIPVDGLMAW